MDGRIFDIQRFSIYDGPGIRTNVFLKGCNLRCKWCHNPESQRSDNDLLFYKDKCVDCGACSAVCDKCFTSACIGCGRCAEVCRHGAREISGRTVSADEVVGIVLRDRRFYKTSGGGVTLSGGEPLLQPDFAAEILEKSKAAGLHTAVETAGNVPWSAFEKVLPYLNLVLFDIKCFDENLHKELTGVSNRLILENAKKLMARGGAIRFRTPVVPGYNDGEIPAIAEFVGEAEYELLAYHETGRGKYDALGREYPMSAVVPPAKEWMRELADSVGAIYLPTGI